MAKQEKQIRPRTAFREFMNYLNAEVLDFEQMEEEGMMETYYKAMEFSGSVAGNSTYSPFYKQDAELMLSIERKTMSMGELTDIMETSTQSMGPRMAKLINFGYASSFKEKKVTCYRLTPYGRKFLEELINNPESVLYDKE